MLTRRFLILPIAYALVAMGGGQAQEKKVEQKKVQPKAEKKLPVPSIPPTAANVPYGNLEHRCSTSGRRSPTSRRPWPSASTAEDGRGATRVVTTEVSRTTSTTASRWSPSTTV